MQEMKCNMTDKEVIEDFCRFIRHEAMRANTTQDKIGTIIVDYLGGDGRN